MLFRSVGGSVRIMVDGGFRDGVDIIKAMGLGAEYILIGRPVAIAAVGMGVDGTAFYMNNIREELRKAMILTGCRSLSDITKDLVKEIR